LLIMRMMPDSSVGILLNNLMERVMNGSGDRSTVTPDVIQTIFPNKSIF